MSKRSDMWRRAQVCMSLARATDDPVLKERYEDLALDLARNAEHGRTFAISNRLNAGHTSPPCTDAVDVLRCRIVQAQGSTRRCPSQKSHEAVS
jgi:hypothetical protein